MYVVKVGEYYVKSVDEMFNIGLSKEMMRNFKKETAKKIAKKINGEVIEIADVETCDIESTWYKCNEESQMSIYDYIEEVTNE